MQLFGSCLHLSVSASLTLSVLFVIFYHFAKS
uniref:Uncharacterized protein n=1 Tax=Arundo donax TaxID=35708 RepID=A0A0A9B6W6_ARUDO